MRRRSCVAARRPGADRSPAAAALARTTSRGRHRSPRRSTRSSTSPSGSPGSLRGGRPPDRSPAASRTTSSSRSSETAMIADARPRGLRARLPAGGRRRRRPERRGDTLDVERTADLVAFESGTTTRHGGRARPRPRATSTRTSGRTRCGWPTSATPSPTRWPTSTPTTPTTTPPTPPTCAPTSRPSTRRTPTGLADCERNTVVVSHDAFGYLSRYGLDIEPIAGLSPDAEPTPADLAELQELIDDDGITTVFSERLAPARLSRDPGRRRSASTPPCSTRSRASPTRRPTRTTFP